MSSIRINLTRTGCCVLFSALALICSLPSYAGTEEVSLCRMSTWSNTYGEHGESIGWNASFDPSTKTITFDADEAEGHEGDWQRIGWNFLWKYINSNYQSFTIEFASAATTNGQVQVTYFDNNESKNKYFNYDSGATSVTCDLQTDFEDVDESGAYSLKYINIGQVQGSTLQLSKVYFTTTDNCDVYQAENTDYSVASLEYLTEADNAIAPITDATHYVDFTISVPYAAVYRLNFGYSTKNGGTKKGNISINNGTGFSFDFTNTGESEVTEVSYSCVLNKGTNHVKVYANWTYFYIDYLRVYEPTLYLIGNQHGTDYVWKYANGGGHMTFDSQTETFSITTRIGTNDNQEDPGTFAFATTIAGYEDLGGQAYVNGHRWGPETDNLIPNTNGTTATSDIKKRSDHAYRVPMAGTYTITVKADLSSFTIQGPAVYMFGLHEGAVYSWGTNNYSMMTYDAANEVYRLRTRIADGAATTGNGEVAFATAYCSTNTDPDWTYLNANRYGPSPSGNPTLNGTTNTIGKNGDVKFTGITAGKYEVVVDMFSATKTARFYPLYTFGKEVVGTHGSITCSTNDTEIPLGGTPTVTAVPDAGYRFVKWTNGSDVQLSTSAEYTPTITADTWLKAWFEPDPECSLTIPANTFAFAKHNDDVYSAADGSFLYEESGKMYFNYTYNDGSELLYPVHLNAGTYFFYCTLSADGTYRKMRLYAQDEVSGTLMYSGKKWSLFDSHDFGTGEATFETKGFTVSTGDYLIALYAKQNTKFSQIEVVGAAGGATANTVALTLSADANGSVISNQINNAKILSGTEVLLLAEPASTYRFEQWSDGSTVNPRTVTMTTSLSLTASFNQTNGCLNTVTIQCESDSVSPSSRPIASPAASNTAVSDAILTNKEGERSIYYAFTLTEPATCSVTLLTPRGDKRQKIYLYSAQLSEGTSLTYSGETFYQVQDPTIADSPNSGANHVYPVCSTSLELAAGKYVIGLYSEYSWSQYDRIVITAGGDDIDCSQADITIAAGDEVELPHSVRNLTVYQGGSATNSHDVRVLNSVTYIRHAYGGANSNEMNKWYPFCLPFSVSDCKVYDEADKADYSIGAIYLKDGDDTGNPTGAGYFYLKYLTNDYTGVQPDEFRNRWAYIGQALPEAYIPYIILFVNHWEDTNSDDHYFEDNPVVKFIGGPQTIEGTAKIDRIPADNGAEAYYYYANNTLSAIHLDDAYVFDKEKCHFDYHEDVTIAPFECYIQATESFKARHRSIAMPRVGQNEDTATATDYTPNNNACRSYIFDITGRLIANNAGRLPRGVYICKQGNETRKLIIY